jgi:D-arabinose 1-dehydrogenase-like Zn-dependent alcohol dehydrogenase
VAVETDELDFVGSDQTHADGSWIDLWEVLQLHARGRLTLKTERYPLEEVNDVLSMLREGDITGRAVLVPGGGERT